MTDKRRSWGSLAQRKKGTWLLRWPMPEDPVTGKRTHASETFHGSKREAEKRLAELYLKYGDKEAVSRRLTVATIWERHYRPSIEALRPSTLAGYDSAWKLDIEPRFGQMIADDIKPAEVQSWLDSMSYGKARKAYATMRAMLHWASDYDLIERDVMAKRYRMPKQAAQGRTVNNDIHDAETLRAIFEACRGECWEAGHILSGFGGLRREEAFGLMWSDITWVDGGCICNIKRTVQRIHGENVINDTKTEASRRAVPILDPYAARLKELQSEEDVFVLGDGFGNPSDPDLISNCRKRWYTTQPFPFIPWKNLRNSYATMLHESGVDLALVSKIMGHTQLGTTYKHYDKPSIEAMFGAAKGTLDTRSKLRRVV